MNGILYVKIFDNGKMYVGITCQSFKKRMNRHYDDAFNRNSQLPVHRAMRKYNHRTEIWADGIDDRELLSQLEIQTISQLKEEGIELYNLTEGGEGRLGSSQSDEAKEKLRILNTGKKLSEETKEKIRIANSGENSASSKPIEYWATIPHLRVTFKRSCKAKNWNFEDFEEVFAEWYNKKNGSRARKYYYIYKYNN